MSTDSWPASCRQMTGDPPEMIRPIMARCLVSPRWMEDTSSQPSTSPRNDLRRDRAS